MRWLEKKLSRFAIPHLTLAYIILIAVVTGGDIAMQPGLGDVGLPSILAGRWWGIVFFPFRLSPGGLFGIGSSGHEGIIVWFFLFMILALFWIFGTAVEIALGAFRYNLYVLVGVLSCLAGSWFMPMGSEYILLGIFLAYAHLYPDQVFLLMFIIPVKVRYIAIGAVILIFYPMVSLAIQSGSLIPILPPLLSLLNYLLFFGPGRFKKMQTMRFEAIRRIASVQKTEAAKPALHKCFVCGRTEQDDPYLEFRYCVDCSDHEYCADHLYNHAHQVD